jgi:type IV secretory pathway VirB6-like protein
MNGVSITFFQLLWTNLALPIQASEQPIIAALQGYVQGWFSVAVGAYLIAILLMAAFNSSEADATLLFRQAFLAGVVWSIAVTAAGTNTYVTGLVGGFINGVTTAIAGVFGGGTVTNAQAFDKMATQLFAIGLVVIKNVPSYAIIRGIVMGILVDMYTIMSLIAVAVMFLIYFISAVMLQFLIGFSPIFIAMFMFPFARQFFDGWVRSVMAAALTQIFIVGLLTLFLTVLSTLLTSLSAGLNGGSTASQIGEDVARELYVLVLAGAMAGIFAFLAVYVARLAQGVSAGAHAQFAKIPGRRKNGGGDSNREGGGSSGGSAGGSVGGGAAGGGGSGGGAAQRQYAFTRSVGGAP